MLIGSLIAATMDPVGLAIARARGIELQPLGLLIWTYLPNYICAFLAVIPSRIIVRLGRKVSRARQLGSYRLVELIGRGGMGEVWKAEHQLFARPAAIKLIAGHGLLEGPGRIAAERFRREAEAAAELRSPHTIQLYDFGIARDRRLYYVMELLEGSDLESLVVRYGPQPPTRVAHILRQACHSLAEAHAAGMVHRDIKPANLHLGPVRAGVRFREGARLRPGEAGSQPALGRRAADGAGIRERHAGLHGAGDGGRRGGGWPRGSLRAGLRRVLPADGDAGVRRRNRDAADPQAPPGRPGAAVHATRPPAS